MSEDIDYNAVLTDCNSQLGSLYFVVKCGSLESLQKCISTGIWAFRKRTKPPQPRDLLEKAHLKRESKVILVFSVNNQHGWHGYCESLFHVPVTGRCENPNTDLDVSDSDTNNSKTNVDDENDEWCRFSVKWISHFQSLNSYGCLPLDKTKDLVLLDKSPVNQARNWTELSKHVGSRICELLDQHLADLLNKKQFLENQKLEAIRAKESFFKEEENLIGFCKDVSTGWHSVIQKVEQDLGKVILACPFGSQRYNCSLPDSDSDILVIYQAKTIDVLGLDRPPQTIKNSHSAKMDFTVLELQRYCELLIAGDPRYVETLFIQEESILAFTSNAWKQLCEMKQLLLTQDCLDKYLREAKGTKGLKQFDKWKNEMKDSTETPPQKMNKLAYIILRLLQSGRDIVKSGHIRVYRKEGSVEKQELLKARLGQLSVSCMQELFNGYISEVEEHRETAVFSQPEQAKTDVQRWLVRTRLADLGL